jgi:HK97 family phage major capsid protein
MSIQALREQLSAYRDEYRQILDENTVLSKDHKRQLDEIGNRMDSVQRAIDAEGRILNFEAGLITNELGSQSTPGEKAPFVVSVEGHQIPMLRNSQRLAAFAPRQDDGFSLANFVRGAMGIGRPNAATTSSPATVPLEIGGTIIDAVRAQSTVVQAGVGTLAIDAPTNLAKIVTDPVCYQHTEGASDISTSDLVLDPVALNPKMLVAAVPVSFELMTDSPNIEDALVMSLSGAMAAKLDSLCLATILADTDIATSAAGQSCATWAGVLSAVGSALAADMGLPQAYIGGEGDFVARASQLATTAGSWLGKPPALTDMVELFTTKVDDGTGIFSDDWFKAFAIAVRSQVRIEILRWSGVANATHLVICHARMDGYVLQPKRLYIQKTTV